MFFTHTMSDGMTLHHYITPSSTILCPAGEHCLTLSALVTNVSHYIESNTMLIFLAGNHSLDVDLAVTEVNELRMLSLNGSVNASIVCSCRARLIFTRINKIQIGRLKLIGCPSRLEFVNQFTLEDSSISDQSGDNSALYISQTRTTIMRSSFRSNRAGHRHRVQFLDFYQQQIRGNIPNDRRANVGGALFIDNSNVSIAYSYFDDNSAQIGGAIFSQMGANITISSCTFVYNGATGCGKQGCSVIFIRSFISSTCNLDHCHGGAIFVDTGSTLIVTNSTFMNNTADSSGGAVVLSQGRLFDVNNVFRYNSVPISRKGGAMSAYDRSKLTMDGSYYEQNEAYEGAVIYLHLRCSITVNSAIFNSNKVMRRGGVMHAESSSIAVNNSSFYTNRAKGLGGVVYAVSDVSIAINSSYFANNSASGGAIVHARLSSITVVNSSFDHNHVGRDGGSISTSSSNIIVRDSSFNNNQASNGGVLHVTSNSIITLESCSFNGNKASISGGAIYADSNSRITMKNSSFNNNEAMDFGGVVLAGGSVSIIVTYTSFDKNKAHIHGGVLYATYSSSITIHSSSFSYNYAVYDGGVMFIIKGSNNGNHYCTGILGEYDLFPYFFSGTVILKNSYFYSNSAGNRGGVMFTFAISSITVDNCSFDKNTASDSGGAVYLCSTNNVTVDSSSFDENTASNSGGVMYGRLSSHITFENECIFFNSLADEGGVVYLYFSNLSDSGSVYSNNTANTNGGVVALNNSIVALMASTFVNNSAGFNGSVVCAVNTSSEDYVALKESSFYNNEARNCGAIAILSKASLLTVTECSFTSNRAFKGGAIYLLMNDNMTIESSDFTHNSAYENGGVIYSEVQNQMSIRNCTLSFNIAEGCGGVLCSLSQSELTIAGNASIFNGNHAHSGGVVYASESTVNVYSENFLITDNTAVETGGALHLVNSKLRFLNERSKLVGNQARIGGALYTSDSNVDIYSQTLLMANNSAAESGGAAHSTSSDINFYSDNSVLIRNQARSGGVMYVSESHINIYGQNLLMAKNTALDSGGAVHLSNTAKLTFFNGTNTIIENKAQKSGGALSLIKGQLTFSGGNNTIVRNQANDGGAIYISNSELLLRMNSLTNVTGNLATRNGGGLYLMGSEMNIEGDAFYVTDNRANRKGGGIHMANSAIVSKGAIHFVSNEAENGGGISLERNAKLSGILDRNSRINFLSNSASRRGGALYIDDETNPAICEAGTTQNATSLTECFSISVFITFLHNSARYSGSNIFGGLLDRCSLNGILPQGTETNKIGIINFFNSSNLTKSELDTISSHPVRLCFCRGGLPDCNYQPDHIRINRGRQFSIELIAYDHVFNAVGAVIDSSVENSQSSTRYVGNTYGIGSGCTGIQFSLFSSTSDSESVESENLTLSMEGPCPVAGISERTITIEISCACPIGFQTYSDKETPCDCVCHAVLQAYDRTYCNASAKSIIRRDNFWITYINRTNSSGYIIYPNCPFDYCYPSETEVSINLTLPNGSDAQCVSNRVGILCGTCKPGYSVSLGSSQCLQCPTNWALLLVMVIVVFIVSGVGLVALLLTLNLTVAVGSLNALIFFANILAANRSALFPSGRVSFASAFISWLNFDIGVDVCFYNGMDTYIKTWLQLAFPAYIIILVIMVIKLSYYFTAFGRLVGRKDPVATLATLILLSYTKLVQTIITVFSSATLHYPDGAKALWLPDATIEYFTGKHAALFFIAVLILLLGSAYTFLLFSWQWVLLCPRNQVKLIINHKFSLFLETYHAPYTPRHRYWTGLLLLIRVSIYLISVFNPSSGDPRITLISTIIVVSLLFVYISGFSIRIYKHWTMNAVETLTYFNIIATSVFTWYTIETNGNQKIVTNISVGIAFTQLVMVILYHTCKYSMFQKLHEAVRKRVNKKLKMRNGKTDQPTVTDIEVPSIKSQPTYSVVELTNLDKPANNGVVLDNNQSAETGNNQSSNHSSGIEAAKQNNSTGCPPSKHTSLNMKSNRETNGNCHQSNSSPSVQLTEGEIIAAELH
jgi:predicted outer membrane repeat protein